MPKNIQPGLSRLASLARLLTVLFAVWTSFDREVLSQTHLPKELAGAVVTISSSSVKGCATGFFLGDGKPRFRGRKRKIYVAIRDEGNQSGVGKEFIQ